MIWFYFPTSIYYFLIFICFKLANDYLVEKIKNLKSNLYKFNIFELYYSKNNLKKEINHDSPWKSIFITLFY